MEVITLMNQKGGVGKSSTTHHLSGTLAAMGHKVLLVDNDPQSSLTQGLIGPDATFNLDRASTIDAIYRGEAPFPDQVIRPTSIPGIDLLPGSVAAADFNLPRPEDAPAELQGCIANFMAEVEGYDFVLIDCPPNLYLASWASLAASRHIVVPMLPEDYGAQGIAAVSESIARVQSGANPSLALLGYLLSRVGKNSLHQMYEERTRARYGEDVFATTVPMNILYAEAIAARMPIAQYKPKGVPAKVMKALAEEFLARVAAHTPLEV